MDRYLNVTCYYFLFLTVFRDLILSNDFINSKVINLCTREVCQVKSNNAEYRK